MKILELSFKNLNSLYGEWHIDFTAPEFEGIFALTGPTGAGKSTILDALCLALYGATPRLGKITQSGNEIMSRRTGECYAELVFQSREGSFRCRWDQWRSRRKTDGALQAPEHQIAEAESGIIIENKKSLVTAVIEEKTGMDFERFTRSVLLAQGSFDSFLKADAEKKSSILEQITGTAVYTEISKAVHERQRDEKERLGLLEAETAGIFLLEKDKEEALRSELNRKQRDETLKTETLKKNSEAAAWLKGMEELVNELSSLEEELKQLDRESVAFAPERKKLEEAGKASALEADFSVLETGRRQLKNDRISLEKISRDLPLLETEFEKQKENFEKAEKELVKARIELQQASPRIKQTRTLDQSIAELNRNIAAKEVSRKGAVREHEIQIKRHQKEDEKLKSIKEEAASSREYLEEHTCDEQLVSGLAGIEERLNNLLTLQSEIKRREKEISEGEDKIKLAEETLKQRQNEKDRALQIRSDRSAGLDLQKNKLEEILAGRLLREYRTEKESLLKEKSLRERIASLEEQRSTLVDGQPCPLCGSVHHPYTEQGSALLTGEIDLKIEGVSKKITLAEEQEELIRALENDLVLANESLSAAELKTAGAEQDINNIQKSLKTTRQNLRELHDDYNHRQQTLDGNLAPLMADNITYENIPGLLKILKGRLSVWQQHSIRSLEAEKEISSLEAELKRLKGLMDLHRKTLDDRNEELKDLNIQRMTLTTDRYNLFAEEDPDSEELRLNALISAAEDQEKQERLKQEGIRGNLLSARTEESSLRERIQNQNRELSEKENDFIDRLKQSHFKDEEDFLRRRLSPEELERLNKMSRELENRNIRLQARYRDRKEKLSSEEIKKLTPLSLTELEPEIQKQEKELRLLRETAAALRQKLTAQKEAEKRLQEKKSAIENQKIECRRWDNLHALIGSADGKRFRNFAQGLTFELMVSHANAQLQKMSDRYLLLRDVEEPLALNVVDNYQAGEIRSVKNLSGGESFIISLSLALGLSHMASRRVQVDSLFLDEGFGTLDEDALETALETLAELHQDGKIIGIISHVAALKERISAQIAVTPSSGGKSTLRGPGCRRITENGGN